MTQNLEPPKPRLLSYDDVSELTGLTPATLRWLRQQGRGPRGFKLGRRVRFYETDVWAWIEKRRSEAA
ncbi:helix-turn-helix transcriptional regulator [Gryllotalpicola koreensis]|uniref:Helix-turn-helix domain-containing protein n=1 Tax=Gryllotalpicola koreensis TaxID=993086 RepID=A0ABP8A2Y2_9MICO